MSGTRGSTTHEPLQARVLPQLLELGGRLDLLAEVEAARGALLEQLERAEVVARARAQDGAPEGRDRASGVEGVRAVEVVRRLLDLPLAHARGGAIRERDVALVARELEAAREPALGLLVTPLVEG